MKASITFALVTSMMVLSCSSRQEKSSLTIAPKVVKARGYQVPKDSMEEPKVIPVGKPKVVRAGKPKVVFINTNVHPAGTPRIITAGMPRVCTPGHDGFSIPREVPGIGNRFIAGIPEVVVGAKDPNAKDQNHQNFSSFGKLHGLKSEAISCMVEDRSGNLWIGTNFGVSRYDGKSFTHFSRKEGMTSTWVISMFEDVSGNLWFGTYDAGVSKYDGESFTNFTVKQGLTHNHVTSILQDSSGNLWFGTGGGGVSRYDGNNFTHFTEKEGLSNNYVTSILQDKDGIFWFGTRGGGVNKFNGKSFTHFTEKEGLSNNNVTSILKDKDGILWFGTRAGLNKFDNKSFSHFTKEEGLSNDIVLSLSEDNNGHLWIGTEKGGVSKYDRKSFMHFTDKEGLSDNEVTSILKDKRGQLWFGTFRGGVNKYGGRRFTHYTIKEGLSDNVVRSILQDKRGNLWFGTLYGVNIYNGKSFTHLTPKEGMRLGYVRNMVEDKNGNIWFADWWGVSRYDGSNFMHFNLGSDVTTMFQDKIGNLWFGTYGGGVVKYDGRNFLRFTSNEGLSGSKFWSILQDKHGNLWFGAEDGGLSRYNVNKTFTHFTEKEGLSDNTVFSMLEDKDGNIWVGSFSGGATKYDGENFTHYTQKEGLSNNFVHSISKDSRGNLWFGTTGGLSKLSRDMITSGLNDSVVLFKNYTYEDGFSGIDVSGGKTIFEAKDETIWIGAGDRLTAYHYKEDTPDTIPPSMRLTGVTLFNEYIAWQNLMSPNKQDGSDRDNSHRKVSDTTFILGNGVSIHDLHFDGLSKWYRVPKYLSLPYDNNYLTFQFLGITIQSPRKVKYQYKLEGQDKNWSALTDRSEANYGNLPHGTYTFKVKAMNGDGYWSSEYHYPFTIRPPWWHTWWAYTLFALVFIGTMYALFRYRLNKVRRDHEIKQKTAELEMQALRAQMNPHFIFNSLNSINLFILENNKLQASEYLSKFSRLVRLILNNSRQPFIPLEQELEALELYLELESLRFEQRFSFKITVDKSIDTAVLKVPPLIIQPYAENAIWHGLMPKKEEGNLDIALYKQDENLVCKITDDGIGRKKAAEYKSKSSERNRSMGMRITADRIAILQDQDESDSYITVNDVVLPDGNPGGTEVVLQIPVTCN